MISARYYTEGFGLSTRAPSQRRRVMGADEKGWTMAQLAEWPAVVTCAPTLEEARAMLLDARDRGVVVVEHIGCRAD